jgi:uncharacterized membrane protein YfcA
MIDAFIPDGWSTTTLALAAAVFLLAGLIKGIAGAGLPTVALALLALFIDIKVAIALLVVPAVTTNIWQGLTGGAFAPVAKRLAPMLLASVVGIWIGVEILSVGDAKVLAGILGIVLFFYAGYSLATPQIAPPGPRAERWLGPPVGLSTGILFGFTGSFLVPGVLYMQALGLKRDHFVQAMGIAFSFSTFVLWLFLAGNGLFTVSLGLVSAIVCIPAFLGMVIGQKLRGGMSEAKFRRVFFITLLALSLYIVARAFL